MKIYVRQKGKHPFRTLPIGTMFIIAGNEDKNPTIWVKTPFAEMWEHNNQENENGAYCNAVCINAGGKNLYMQCCQETMCKILNAESLFGLADYCKE